MTTQPELPILRPTVPGMARGIVDLDPFTLQCGECGATVTGARPATTVILSGFHFHACEDGGPRRCRDCLKAAKAACPSGRCRR